MKCSSLFVFAVICLVPGCDESAKGKGMGRYSLGITLDEARLLMKQKYEVNPYPIEYSRNPSVKEYETTEEFYVTVADEGLTLYFNHYKKLIRIEEADRKGKDGGGRPPK